jgi:hypothetical protein
MTKFYEGQMIQVWDSIRVEGQDDCNIRDHGRYGVIMRESKLGDTFFLDDGTTRTLSNIVEGDVFMVHIMTDGGGYMYDKPVHIHKDNMRLAGDGGPSCTMAEWLKL